MRGRDVGFDVNPQNLNIKAVLDAVNKAQRLIGELKMRLSTTREKTPPDGDAGKDTQLMNEYLDKGMRFKAAEAEFEKAFAGIKQCLFGSTKTSVKSKLPASKINQIPESPAEDEALPTESPPDDSQIQEIRQLESLASLPMMSSPMVNESGVL